MAANKHQKSAFQIILGKCPACTKVSIFKGLLAFKTLCTDCGFEISKQDVGDAHAYVAICVVGLLITVTACIVEIHYSWPLWLHMLVWTSLVFALSIGCLRLSKSLFIHLQYRYNAEAFKTSTTPINSGRESAASNPSSNSHVR